MNKTIGYINTAVQLIKVKGECSLINCKSCPLNVSNRECFPELTYGGCPSIVSTIECKTKIERAYLYLIRTLGEQETKELVVEELI